MIKIQKENFNVETEIESISKLRKLIGLSIFIHDDIKLVQFLMKYSKIKDEGL